MRCFLKKKVSTNSLKNELTSNSGELNHLVNKHDYLACLDLFYY